jgi:hypothetical protein
MTAGRLPVLETMEMAMNLTLKNLRTDPKEARESFNFWDSQSLLRGFSTFLFSLEPPSRRGRMPKVDWEGTVRPRLFTELDYRGDLLSGDMKWRCLADIERFIANFIDETFDESAATSTIRTYARKYLDDWRSAKSGG